MKTIALRDYQDASIEGLREGIRAGHRLQILVAPTGAGKTTVATWLLKEAYDKFSRAVFICDRVALIDQTSATFDQYGLPHGVIQGSHWRWRPYERIQVASAQTLARRGAPEGMKLIVVDECHSLFKATTEFIRSNEQAVVVGLTATPFTKGLGKIYTNVVNVTTTDKLIDEQWLVPLKIYAAKAVDMTGAKLKFDGEWAESEIETRSKAIIGDIVSEWTAKTIQYFGKPVKTIVFSATVAHGDELCGQFQEAGHNFQQISYKDGNDDRRRALIEEFRKPDSEITGLVSCEALAKGFDVPDILVGVCARPYRKSLSAHIQQMGRVMRPAPGKQFALWIDHAGNVMRFMDDTSDVFQHGVHALDDGERDAKVRQEPVKEDSESRKCGACSFIMPKAATHCPACGWERPRRKSNVITVDGQLSEIDLRGKVKATPDYLQDRGRVWNQLVHYSLERKGGDVQAAKKFALAQYRNLFQDWPRSDSMTTPEFPHPKLVGKVQRNLIAYFKRQAA